MSHIQQFIGSRENPNTAKVAKYVLKNATTDIENLSAEELKEFILELRPKSQKQITTICYILGAYAEWLSEQNSDRASILRQNVQAIDKKNLWKIAKPKAEKKFISYTQYVNILHDINVYEEYNPLYFDTLFSCIYEGIYCDDLSVLKNLRGSDVDGTTVTLHEDNGQTYKIKVTPALANKLKELANFDIWKRPNRYGICKVSMTGLYTDAVFKVEKRTTTSENARRFPYYDRLRKIKDEYVGYDLSPLHLYASGVIHRIKYLLEKHNISLTEAFADNCRNRVATTIITNELERCNGIMEIGNFRELIKGHIDVFSEDTTDDISKDLFDTIHIEPPKEYLEGEELLTAHLTHERNEEVVSLAKLQFKANHSGRIFCEKCGFDFGVKYGERGVDFIEAHHIKPLATRTKNEITKVEDIVLLCSNCHSIVHRKKPWLSMDELEAILRGGTI